MKISVVVPVYNEKNTIEEIINRIRKVEIDKEIIVVDDGSTDGSREVLRKFEGNPDIKLVLKKKMAAKDQLCERVLNI